jgi:hypothetical protein
MVPVPLFYFEKVTVHVPVPVLVPVLVPAPYLNHKKLIFSNKKVGKFFFDFSE